MKAWDPRSSTGRRWAAVRSVTPQDVVAECRQDNSVRMGLRRQHRPACPAASRSTRWRSRRDGLVLSLTKPARLPGIVAKVDDSDLVRFAGGAFTPSLRRGRRRAARLGRGRRRGRGARPGGGSWCRRSAARASAGCGRRTRTSSPSPRSAMGVQTAGRWRPYLDGSDIDLSGRGEDVDAVAVDATGAIDLSVSRGARRSRPCTPPTTTSPCSSRPISATGRPVAFAPKRLPGGTWLGLGPERRDRTGRARLSYARRVAVEQVLGPHTYPPTRWRRAKRRRGCRCCRSGCPSAVPGASP